jgi:PUB domain/Ubiquitin family
MQLRQEVSQATKIPLTDLRLIFRGKMIKDDSSPAATTYQLENEDVLHCMGKPVSALAPLPAAASRAHIDVGVAAAATPNIPPASLPVVHPDSTVDPLQSSLTTLRTSNPPQVYCTAVTTLATVLSNIADNPMEEKYRKVKKGNVAFNKKLGGLNGGDDAMKAVGFIIEVQDGAEFYQMHASPEAWSKLMESKATVEAAAVEAKRSLDTPVPPVGGANPLFPGAAAGAMHDPMMQGTMAEMMRNPEMMRSMLQVSECELPITLSYQVLF